MEKEIVADIGEATVTTLVGPSSSNFWWALSAVSLVLVVVYVGQKVPDKLMANLESDVERGIDALEQCCRDDIAPATFPSLRSEIRLIRADADKLNVEVLEMKLRTWWNLKRVLLGNVGLSYRLWQCRDRAQAFFVSREIDLIQHRRRV